MNTPSRHAIALLLFACSFAAAAQDSGNGAAFPRPLPATNQSPVTGVFGFPRAGGVDMPGRGGVQWDATLDLTSHFEGSEKGAEAIFFDGETARLAIRARYGISDDWSLGIEVPWVRHGAGFLDGFIIEWHDLWGFPQGGRKQAPENEISYRYDRGGETRLEIESATGGIGDVVASARRRLWRNPDSAGVFHVQAKLPTGDADKLTGSGATDIAAGIELSRRWHPQWHSMFRAGAAWLGNGEVLPELQRNWGAWGGLDLVWRPLRPLSLRVQFDAHTAPYENSALRELEDWSGMLSTGLTWHIDPGLALDLAVVENVPNARPVSDVSFQIRLRSTPGGSR